VEHPGLAGGHAVPDSPDTLAVMHAETVRRQVGDEPVVLVGYCSGGAVAHATAGRLAATGPAPVGLIMIDTHHTADGRRDDRLMALMARDAAQPPELFGTLFEDSLILAGGAYARIFEDWRPEPLAVPTVLLRADTPTDEMRSIPPGDDWRSRWPLPHETVDIPGDHFTVLDEDAGTTAAAIRAWVDIHAARVGGAA
jgi:thioesterase domain-containing protein